MRALPDVNGKPLHRKDAKDAKFFLEKTIVIQRWVLNAALGRVILRILIE